MKKYQDKPYNIPRFTLDILLSGQRSIFFNIEDGSSDNIPIVRLKQIQFTSRLILNLKGLLTVENCVMNSSLIIQVKHSKFQEKIENKRSFQSYVANHMIEVVRSSMRTRLRITTEPNVARGFFIGQSVLLGQLSFTIGEGLSSDSKSDETFVDIQIDNCSMFSNMTVWTRSTGSFVLVDVKNSHFEGPAAESSLQEGTVGFSFENCTMSSSTWIFKLNKVLLVSVKNCQFTMPEAFDCEDGFCLMDMNGLRISAFRIVEWYSLFYPDRKVGFQPLAIIQDSTFVGSGGGFETEGGSVRIVESDIRISNVTYALLAIPPVFGTLLVLSGGHQINLNNVILDMGDAIPDKLFVSIVTFKEGRTIVEDVEIICPRSFQLEEKMATQHQLNCDKLCSDTEYSFQNGRGTLNGSSPVQMLSGTNYLKEKRSLILHKTLPICNACPIGAVCNEHGVKPIPGYWGYFSDVGSVTMIRCPTGYCCTGSDNCLSVTSCNDERLGTLCGHCGLNLTESLFSPKAVPIGKCSSTIVMFLYTVCALIYAIILLTAGVVKEKVKGALKFVLSFLRRSRTNRHEHKEAHELAVDGSKIEERDPNSHVQVKTTEAGPVDEATSSVAYVQILFYFVQDSSLFKVDLPRKILLMKPFG